MAETVDIPKRLPLVVEPENRDETTSKDARLVNAYMETRSGGQGPETHIFQRVGLSQSTRPPAAPATGRGIFNWKGDIYSVFGTTLYKGTTSKGTVDGTNGLYRFDRCLGATPKLQLGNGVKAYNYDDGAGLVQITDVDFPSAFVKGWGYLDGTTYVMDANANIQGDNINDPTAWDPLNKIVAQIVPDGGVALAKQLVYIIALKQESVEVFYDAGNAAGSPLGAVQGAKVNHGCASADSVRDLDGVLYWLATNRNAGLYVMAMDNLKAEVISTKPIERLLDNWDLTTIYSWTLKHDGHKFYGVTSVVSNQTFVYDATERLWTQWADQNGNYWPIVDSTYTSTLGHLLQHETNGKIYLADTAYSADDGNTITVDIYTPNFDGGTKRMKFLSALYFDCDRAKSELLVRCNDYDYDSTKWSNFRRLNLDANRPGLTDCGSFVRRAYHFRHQKPGVRMPRVKAVDLQIDVGTL